MAHLPSKHALSSLSIFQFSSHSNLASDCSGLGYGVMDYRRWRRNFRFQLKLNRSFRLLIDPKLRVSCKLQDNRTPSEGEEPPESLFMKELKRRGMNHTSLLEESKKRVYEDDMKFKEEDRDSSRKNAISMESGSSLYNQREQSMVLNSEGIEGLIPRAKLLLTLGGTFFLGLMPLILLIIAFFSALYLYFGPTFIHEANTTHSTPSKYIDPYALLEEERIS
ncbi:unnamed protein product [Cuscuta campestris]|uniref:Uncharacterized protein n=1 Tax=Cuscuta campestris TaxID=132261 RepID=A0A484L6R7_9ASTE|nr:unnamed protein product [Cuscuta campestris]